MTCNVCVSGRLSFLSLVMFVVFLRLKIPTCSDWFLFVKDLMQLHLRNLYLRAKDKYLRIARPRCRCRKIRTQELDGSSWYCQTSQWSTKWDSYHVSYLLTDLKVIIQTWLSPYDDDRRFIVSKVPLLVLVLLLLLLLLLLLACINRGPAGPTISSSIQLMKMIPSTEQRRHWCMLSQPATQSLRSSRHEIYIKYMWSNTP